MVKCTMFIVIFFLFFFRYESLSIIFTYKQVHDCLLDAAYTILKIPSLMLQMPTTGFVLCSRSYITKPIQTIFIRKKIGK